MKTNDGNLRQSNRVAPLEDNSLTIRTRLTKGIYVKLYCTHITIVSNYFKANCVIVLLSHARTYIHLFEDCVQNWFAVASIIENTLTTLKAANPNIQEAFLRSDNAGCYHCAYLILSLPSLGERAGIRIVRHDFSDPQAGKDICDR